MGDFQVIGRNAAALFTLKLHRGDGMCLLAMNWKNDKPTKDFVGFAIEYREPGGNKFFTLKNRLSFPGTDGKIDGDRLPTLLAPIQKFRWVHFPRNADLAGDFTYRVTPVFMNDRDELSYGEAQTADIQLARETYPGQLNVTFTRGFVSSQAFVGRYVPEGQNPDETVRTLLPGKAEEGLSFVPTHRNAFEAYHWMGFEARDAILRLLDEAIADKSAQVRVVAYDLNEPEVVARLEKLGKRLRIIIDDDGGHGKAKSAESAAASRLEKTAAFVKRQHMGKLQHNKTIVVKGNKVKACVCGSTNFSWRGFYVQNNNALILRGANPVKTFMAAYDAYEANNDASGFGKTGSARWNDLKLKGLRAQVGFSPRSGGNAVLDAIADDIANNTTSSLFFSLAFLYQTPGAIRNAIRKIQKDAKVFSYGISDHAVQGLSDDGDSAGGVGVALQKPDTRVTLVYPEEIAKNIPAPFKREPAGGGGTRMHHKFIVLDFDKPTARVYLGSFNFSEAADVKNGENLLVIHDRRVAVSYMIEALRIFDHYHFRVAQADAKHASKSLQLKKPPRKAGERAWWVEDYTNKRKILDRELFS
jgi:phosphatidylserine/phosphatidylglycerophosphate/cardiolipin synthase-like enzyme